MKLFEGTLNLVKSKNPPVFRTPVRIRYSVAPKKGQAFIFMRDYDIVGSCNLSTVQKISKFDGFVVIETLNSYYTLTPIGEMK